MSLENLKNEDKSNWGGSRAGSGRKPRLQYEARELFYEAIDEEWGNIIKLLRYHLHKGDKEMIKWILEQRIGRAPQTMDINAKGTILTVSEPISEESKIDVMAIASRVSKELQKIKTDS